MINFDSDYIKGCHPKVLEKLILTNMESLPGYGTDKYTISAKEKIKKAVGDSEASVFFIAGGTETNQMVISTMLKPYEGVISADSGHINVHEAGAIEYTGHKVLSLKSNEGKINAKDIEKYCNVFYSDPNHEHMIFPGMVYISFPTEYGTIYKKEELKEIKKTCEKYDMSLFIDGARLGYGLMSNKCDLTIKDIYELSDSFYIGGTKVGALIGEAIVFKRGKAPKNFYTLTKRSGAMLAKGRLIGISFDTLFEDDLYFKISKNAIDMAEELKNALIRKGYEFYIDSSTNQQFIIVKDEKLKEFEGKIGYSFWEKLDGSRCVIRLATSWATTIDDIKELERLI